MSSTVEKMLADLEQDVPVRRKDIAALRRAAATPIEDPFAAVQRLVESLPPKARRLSRKTHAGCADFELH